MNLKKIAVRSGLLVAGFLVATAPAYADITTAMINNYGVSNSNFVAWVTFIDPTQPIPQDYQPLTIPVASTTDFSMMHQAAINAINAYATFYSYPVTNIVDATGISPWVFNYPTLAVNTSRQASATRNATVNASVDVTATLSLISGQTGKVALQYADDSSFTTNVKTAQSSTNGNTGSLTIGLNLGQTITATVSGDIPPGKYYRLVTTNVSGTPTYGTPTIQEVIK